MGPRSVFARPPGPRHRSPPFPSSYLRVLSHTRSRLFNEIEPPTNSQGAPGDCHYRQVEGKGDLGKLS